jgi:hypothetical protein
MILPTLNSNPSTAAESFAVESHWDQDTLSDSSKPDHRSCTFQIDRVVRQIDSPEVRDIVSTVFADLLRLLECLCLIESHLRQPEAAEETFALFQIIHDEARVLVEFIREDGLNCAAMDEDLTDTLDGIAFAVNHDLQRIFETEPRRTVSETPSGISDAHVALGKLYRAHDVLTNCLQQSTITLAMMFDPELDGASLFNNSDVRYRQSLQLCQDLSALIQLVETAENDDVEPALSSLTAGMEKFRHESMECLMYSDWPQFESFCERIQLGSTGAPELESVLHQFRCYLETLLGQVRMRAVLVNVFPIQLGANDTAQWPTADVESSPQFSASFDLQDQDATWNPLAVAV